MQNVFNRQRSKYKKPYEAWRENGPGAYQHFQRDDWYWKTDTSYKDRRTNPGSTPGGHGKFLLSHHYSVLGLDRYADGLYACLFCCDVPVISKLVEENVACIFKLIFVAYAVALRYIMYVSASLQCSVHCAYAALYSISC